MAVYSIATRPGVVKTPQFELSRDGVQLLLNYDAASVVDWFVHEVGHAALEHSERDYLLIHAGAVASPSGDGVVLTGESGSGKTTTVAALVLEGYGYLSDEAAVIGLDTSLLQPWPRPLHFKPEAQSIERFQRLFESREPRGRNVRAECLRAGALGAPCKVRHIIDYRYVPGAATELDPLSRAEALALLGSASPGLRHHGERGLRVLARVVRDASAYRLRSGDLSQAVGAVRALAEP